MSLFPPIVVMTLALLSFVPAAQAHGTQAAPADMASVEQKPFGIAGDPRKATRTIKVSMSDTMRFKPNSITVRQGKTGEIAWTFNEPGDFNFACLIAGHFESGMQGKITVLPAKDSKQESK